MIAARAQARQPKCGHECECHPLAHAIAQYLDALGAPVPQTPRWRASVLHDLREALETWEAGNE